MSTNTFYILESSDGNRFFSYDRENNIFGWNKCSLECAEKFSSYYDAKDFANDKNYYTARYPEEFLNCRIRKLTITIELSDCEEHYFGVTDYWIEFL